MSAYMFPEDFVFGGATAAYQVEGETRGHGKGKVIWDDFLAEQGRFTGDPASDFYHRYPTDLELCERFGINGIRVSIAWTRIFPEGEGALNQEGVDYYHELFACCRAHGVEPFVTLHHFDTPDCYGANGGFLDRHVIDAYEAYARFCFAEFPEVTHWFTFNEIPAVAGGTYIEGTWPYGEKLHLDKAAQTIHNMMVAHARAVVAYKEGGYTGEIGIVHNLEPKYPLDPNSLADIQAARNEDMLLNQFILDATFLGSYAPDTIACVNALAASTGGTLDIRDEDLSCLTRAAELNDCLGINNYMCKFLTSFEGESDIHHNGTGEKGTSRWRVKGIGEHANRPGIPTTDWDWIIYPEGLFDLLMRIKNDYPNYKKIYITENGMGYKDELKDGIVDDGPRIDYLRQYLTWIAKAIDGGVNVAGYFVWSLQDQFSWTNGYNKRYGLFYVDFDSQERTPKASAYWYKNLAAARRLDA
ncbi:6-phospho-beta-galactosidase [Collinsella intestinalis]|uniref:6-phospho-beta-galactosidase n=1 Tax=Collinsella intestinalis TaxID=147207 RepID=UPI00195E9583|nr:6-phospho-beta-galactosidase [Collinsella intestinalis]MBM6682633.1 6-phospho-beta-galactosidase [Collinsella intestinalis]